MIPLTQPNVEIRIATAITIVPVGPRTFSMTAVATRSCRALWISGSDSVTT